VNGHSVGRLVIPLVGLSAGVGVRRMLQLIEIRLYRHAEQANDDERATASAAT